MEKIYDICCGIDVHKKLIVACLQYPRKKEIRDFWCNHPGTDGDGGMAVKK